MLNSGDITSYKADKAENATRKIIAHTTEENLEDNATPVAYEKWSKVKICEYIAAEWNANRLPAKRAFQQYFIKEHGKILMTKRQIHGLKSSIYKELLETSTTSYNPGSKIDLPLFTKQEVNALTQVKVLDMLISNVTKTYIPSANRTFHQVIRQ